MNSVNLIAFGTFGNPNGFTQTFFAGNPIRDIKTFDIRGSILIYPKSKLYSIRKEVKNRQNIISYSIYTYAKEPTSAREGSFIGSSILFVDKTTEENIIIKNLNEFHENLVKNNVQDDSIKVNHSEKFDVKDCKPKDFDKISFNLKDIEDLDFAKISGKGLFVFCETNPDKLQLFFKKSVDLLNVYDTIYFTSNEEIATFVNQKGMFKLIQNVGDKKEFEQEIQNLHDERKRKIQESISEFEKEKQKLEEAREHTYLDFQSKIEKNEESHRENERKIRESKSDLSKINDYYKSFSQQIDELLNQLKSGRKKLDEVKLIYDGNKKVFRENIGSLKITDFVNSLSQPQATTTIREAPQPKPQFNHQDKKREEKQGNLDYFKVATFILSLLLFASVASLIWFNKDNFTEKEEIKPEIEETPVVQTEIIELNPKPNSDVDSSEVNKINEKLMLQSKIDSVTDFVFKANPSSIKEFYRHQKKDYSKLLYEKNKESFEITSTKDTLYIKDLQNIPNYQK